jgi:hypothetical protein
LADGHVAGGAFAVLFQLLAAERVAFGAAGGVVYSDVAGAFVAYPAPWRLSLSGYCFIGAVGGDVPGVAAVEAGDVS